MAQHFLLSSAAKSLNLGQVARMSDGEVERVFIRLRWADNGGQPYCPKCGATTVWQSRRKGCVRYQCKACQKDFSLTSGTLFASRKMPLRAYLMAITIFAVKRHAIGTPIGMQKGPPSPALGQACPGSE